MSRIHDQLSQSVVAPPPGPPANPPAEQPRPAQPAAMQPKVAIRHPGLGSVGRAPPVEQAADAPQPPARKRVPLTAAVIAVGIAVVATAFLALTIAKPSKEVAHDPPPVTPPAAAVAAPAPQPVVSEPVPEAAPADPMPAPEPPALAAAPSWPTLDIEGARIGSEGDSLVLVFDYGLFARVDQLRPEALEALGEFAEAVKPHLDHVDILVTGFTDNDPVPANRPYKTNYDLGMLRASAVTRFLVEAGIPPARIATRSLGDQQTPYPNDTPQNKARNRTASLTLRPGSSGTSTP